MAEPSLSTAQRHAYDQLLERVRSDARRPTYLLTGPASAGKSTVARAVAKAEDGWYWNFVLDGLADLFAVQNPFHMHVPNLHQRLLNRIEETKTDLVVLDGLESALTGLIPVRRQELLGLIRLLQAQTTGSRLLLVLPSQPGSGFLTPSDLTGLWEDPRKIVILNLEAPETLIGKV